MENVRLEMPDTVKEMNDAKREMDNVSNEMQNLRVKCAILIWKYGI